MSDAGQLPEGAVEIRRITIVEYLDTDGEYLTAEWFEGDFTGVQKLGMLEQAKVSATAPMCRSWPEDEGDDDG